MGYRDDFYVKANIIGYTGNKMESDKLTVYFQKGREFGRITQDYPEADNIGRNEVRSYADYRIYNNKDGEGEEFYGGEIQHSSRYAFVSVPKSESVTITVLAKAITAYPNIKTKYNK